MRLAQKPVNLLVSFQTEQGQVQNHLSVRPPAKEDRHLGPTKGNGLLVGPVGNDQPVGSLSL